MNSFNAGRHASRFFLVSALFLAGCGGDSADATSKKPDGKRNLGPETPRQGSSAARG